MSDERVNENCESQTKMTNKLINITTSAKLLTTQSTSEISCSDELKDTLLKSLLSTSTALSSSLSSSTAVPLENMITKEFNDTQLNLKKILYEPEAESPLDKDKEFVQNSTQKNLPDIQMIDDDDRLVIDISDDEIEGQKKNKNINKVKSMPILNLENENNRNTNGMPKSITYSVGTSGVSNNCVKIDILSSTGAYYNSDSIEVSKVATTTVPKNANISLTDELNILNHEIDKQINKKTSEILELVKEYLGNNLSELEFHSKMNEIGNISVNDISTISKKLIKRQKFEANPNQKDFMRMKLLQFPTSSNDLVNYFKNLIPSTNKNRFVTMIKFYEIIIKEMFNLNKTKILQYLIDFMIKRKNAQLDMLNYNYESHSSLNLKQKKAPTFEIPDSTQCIIPEGHLFNQIDTSYNFVIRSDPIYLTAGSTFVTNHKDVIKSRSIPCVQNSTFDNHIFKGRRIGRSITNGFNEEQSHKSVPIMSVLSTKISSIEESLTKTKYENKIYSMPNSELNSDNISPILVDTPSTSPPIHKIIKPHILSQKILHRTFSEKILDVPVKEQKKEFDKYPSSRPSISVQQTNQDSIGSKTYNNTQDPIINEHLSFNEIKSLNQNGTEILRNTITSRRKTVDIDHTQANETPVEIKRIQLFPVESIKSPSAITVSKPKFLYEHPQINKQSPKILKRRQSCHERVFTSKSPNLNDIEKRFTDFVNDEYDSERTRATDTKTISNFCKNDEKYYQQQLEIQKTMCNQLQHKRVRFMNDETSELNQRVSSEKIPFTLNSQKTCQTENPSPRVLYNESLQSSIMQEPLKAYQSPIDYQRYQQYFERELRERGFVDRVETIQDRDLNSITLNRPLELISHVPPERYHQHSGSSQSNTYSSPKLTRITDKSPRMTQRTPIMTSDEKATRVAYNQLQSLHRDPTNLTAQQYSEHLKQIHQFKQMQKSVQERYSDHKNQLIEAHDKSFKNIQQHADNTNSPIFYPQHGQDVSNDREQQSLQRKLKLRAKSTKYVEPNQLSKTYQSPPRSTYYTDPYTMTTLKKPLTPIGYNHLQERPIDQHSQEQLNGFYNMRTETSINPQLQYQWILAHHHQQQQQHQQQNMINQPARPIPRQAMLSSFNDAKINGVPDHNIFPHNPLQAFPNQQPDYYRRYFPKSF